MNNNALKAQIGKEITRQTLSHKPYPTKHRVGINITFFF